MNYVKGHDINGVFTKQVACIELHGKPNAATEGAVGVLGIDVDSPIHDVYKCVAVNGSIYSWELLSSGLSILSANLRGEGAVTVEFPYNKVNLPLLYVIKVGDSIMDLDGYLYQVSAIGASSCSATYCNTQIVAYGKSAYALAVEQGFEGTVDEWLVSLRGSRGIYVGSGEMPDYADIQIDPDSEDVDYVVVQETGDSMASVMSQKATTDAIANGVTKGGLKGTATGEAVRMSDVSPLDHEMVVKVSSDTATDLSSVKVLKFGKNLINRAAATVNKGTLTFDGSKQTFTSLSGNGDIHYTLGNYQDFVGKKITISFQPISWLSTSGRDGFTTFIMADKTEITRFNTDKTTVITKTVTIPENPDADKLIIRQYVGYMTTAAGDYVTVDSLQVEIGDAATEWEDFAGMTEYTVNADGTVTGVTSLYPTTTLMTDTEGAIIDVEYGRDLNKAFAELASIVDALVGG